MGSYKEQDRKYHHWKCGEKYYIAEVFNDGAYHLFRSNNLGQELSENLLTHNMSGKEEAIEFCLKDNT